MHIQVIIGSVRRGRRAGAIGEWVVSHIAAQSDMTVEVVDLRDWNLPYFDAALPPIAGNYADPLQRRWADTISRGDAYLFICPEYNHGYPAPLKNAIDFIYGEWGRKPASIVSYGSVGGARSVEQLRLVLIELQIAPLRDAVHLVNVSRKFDGLSFAGDSDDDRQLNTVLEELRWWGVALRHARGRVLAHPA